MRYGEIEKAIASLHGVTEQSSGVFRGRLRHFQKLGIVPSSPGRGAKIDYNLKAAVDWAVAFELAEIGVQPELIKHFIERCGQAIFDFFVQPTPDSEDRFLCFDAAFLTMHMNRLYRHDAHHDECAREACFWAPRFLREFYVL